MTQPGFADVGAGACPANEDYNDVLDRMEGRKIDGELCDALARLRRCERAAGAEQKRLKAAIAKANAVRAGEADFP
jgi:hypothetical protein